MLSSLHIQNYALIEELDIDFSSGFSVITGETGAGKSIILGAIGLLLGQRADVKSLRQNTAKCVIEAHFKVGNYGMEPFFHHNNFEYDEECILRREIYATGKSRAFINDTPAALSLMKEIGEQLIDIHSQHQNLLLNKEGFQLNVLDIIAHNEGELSNYQQLYKEYKKTEAEWKDIIQQANQSQADEDYIKFQLEQLSEAHLVEGEQEELEEEVELLSHAEEIKATLYKLEQLFSSDDNGLASLLKEGISTLSNLQKIYPSSSELYDRMQGAYIELKDIFDEISNKEESIEYNPLRLNEANDRLNTIFALQQKHRVSNIGDLINILNDYEAQLNKITSFEDRIEELKQLKEKQFGLVKEQSAVLTRSRLQSAQAIEKEISERLSVLGMPNVQFKIEMGKRDEVGVHGEDTVNFLFSANKNGSLQNISTVASGGEIARIMLSIKALIAGAVKLPTIVFDEIDTGVSGEIADRMADIMEEMGKRERQVISITHLPQIASRGKEHYKVYKLDNENETVSHIRSLTTAERIEEIAHMLSGATITDAALENAKALLKEK